MRGEILRGDGSFFWMEGRRNLVAEMFFCLFTILNKLYKLNKILGEKKLTQTDNCDNAIFNDTSFCSTMPILVMFIKIIEENLIKIRK